MYVRDDPAWLLYTLDNLPSQFHTILASGTVLLQDLAPDENGSVMIQEMSLYSPSLVPHVGLPLLSGQYTPSCAPWLLSGALLLAINAYLPTLSPISALWTPVREVIPALHWLTSWWILPPGWEPNLVGLAPLSLNNIIRQS
ncbi:hypothetical protein DSO57_1002620 [Entomophthora muscae]|uniref:Uncharacterized protein n=1 Tax=Entomophthora muscae TaxID=34485 RepID=A0ACC2SXL7_9FUNG|nr:hypothetical protein DSO57_1002620 [Entomophthora muscae]